MTDRKFKLTADQIKELADCVGGCFATDHITVDGRRVGFMYREDPDGDGDWDTGWRFFSGYESDDYVNDPDNVEIYQVNTIANYDPDKVTAIDSLLKSFAV